LDEKKTYFTPQFGQKNVLFQSFLRKKSSKKLVFAGIFQKSTTKDYKITYKSDQAYRGMKRAQLYSIMQND
jgi:hypothetical protein